MGGGGRRMIEQFDDDYELFQDRLAGYDEAASG